MEWVLWARKAGAEEWQEDLITSTADRQHLAKAKAWAIAQGFVGFRVSRFNGERPDFIGAIKGITRP